VIDKVGALIGGMTYGAKKDTGLRYYLEALKLNPTSAIAMIEYANGMVMLEGDKCMKEATALYERAAASNAAGRDGEAGRGDGPKPNWRLRTCGTDQDALRPSTAWNSAWRAWLTIRPFHSVRYRYRRRPSCPA